MTPEEIARRIVYSWTIMPHGAWGTDVVGWEVGGTPTDRAVAQIADAIRAAAAAERERCARAVASYGFGQAQPAVEGLCAALAEWLRAERSA